MAILENHEHNAGFNISRVQTRQFQVQARTRTKVVRPAEPQSAIIVTSSKNIGTKSSLPSFFSSQKIDQSRVLACQLLTSRFLLAKLANTYHLDRQGLSYPQWPNANLTSPLPKFRPPRPLLFKSINLVRLHNTCVVTAITKCN